jgi:hypothetical protein
MTKPLNAMTLKRLRKQIMGWWLLSGMMTKNSTRGSVTIYSTVYLTVVWHCLSSYVSSLFMRTPVTVFHCDVV